MPPPRRDLPLPPIPRANRRGRRPRRQQQPLPSPLGEGGPAGPDEGQAPVAAHSRANRRAGCPHPAATSRCRQHPGRDYSPCLPPWGKVAPQGRMRGRPPLPPIPGQTVGGGVPDTPRRLALAPFPGLLPAKPSANGHPPGNHPQTSAHANPRAGHARPLPGDNPTHLYTT